jgi:soluble lytic murein transglycosylase-like protein
MKKLILTIVIVGLSGQCLAYSARQLSRIVCEIATKYDVSPYLVAAIIEKESLYWPWAVNMNGKGYYFKDKQTALEFVKRLNSYDLGLMQINSWWIRKFNLDVRELIEPENNILMGIFIIKECTLRMGNNLENILSCYHRGRINERGIRYARKVLEIYQTLSTSPLSSERGPARR